MKETKQKQAKSLPQSFPTVPESLSQGRLLRHANMISCHASPVALLRSNRIQVKVNATAHQQGFTAGKKHFGKIPEEKGQGLKKGLEVVVMIYCVVLNQLNVSKHLRKWDSRWFTSNLNIHGQSLNAILRTYTDIKKGPSLCPQKLKTQKCVTEQPRISLFYISIIRVI